MDSGGRRSLEHATDGGERETGSGDAVSARIACGVLGDRASVVFGVEFEARWAANCLAELLAVVADNELVAVSVWRSVASAAFQTTARVDMAAHRVTLNDAHSLLDIESGSLGALTLHRDAIDALAVSVAVVGVGNLRIRKFLINLILINFFQ